jgi:hypothetical protein
MDCSRTKELISEYIDGLLDREQEAEVKDHLLQCGDCRDEFESMKAVVREIGSLDRVEAPDSFLADLHGRMEKDSWFEKVKNILSMPARIKIPVELATLATTVVLAFFIFHIVQLMPLKGPADLPVDLKDKKSEVEIRSGETASGTDSGTKATEQIPVTDKIMPAPQKKQKIDALKAMPAAPPEPPAVKASKATSAPSGISEPLQMLLLLRPAGGIMGLSPESKSVDEKPMGKAARIPAPVQHQARAKADMAEVKSKNEALLAGKTYEEKEKPVVYKERLLAGIEECIRNAGGAILKTDINKETNQPEYLLVEIPSHNYQKLAEKLAEFGKVQTPFAGDVSQFKEPVQIRIRIVSPN